MNDYKELIDSLRICVKYKKAAEALCNAEFAADAIEQLVKERDAAIEKALDGVSDAEPVVHGRWIELWFDEEDRLLGELPSDYKCSVCGGIVPRKTFQSGKYCPNCGAKMFGGSDEE